MGIPDAWEAWLMHAHLRGHQLTGNNAVNCLSRSQERQRFKLALSFLMVDQEFVVAQREAPARRGGFLVESRR